MQIQMCLQGKVVQPGLALEHLKFDNRTHTGCGEDVICLRGDGVGRRAFARAILADPDILILDEAASNVDTRTEKHVPDALLRLMQGRTSFVIAHRLSTIRDADEVLVINGGEVIERGTHDSLLALDGFYHHLYHSQFKGQLQPPLPA